MLDKIRSFWEFLGFYVLFTAPRPLFLVAQKEFVPLPPKNYTMIFEVVSNSK